MPLIRYFVVAGGFLLALLFVADWYWPEPAPMASYGTPIDEAILRIHSDRKWPSKVVIDTSIPTIIPPAAAATVAATPPPSPALNALAQARPPERQAVEKPKARVRHTRISRREVPMRFAVNPTPPAWPPGW